MNSIGDYAFAGNGLSYIIIPSNISQFGFVPFAGCNELEAVISEIETPFETTTNILGVDDNYSTVTLYVPKGTKEKYEATRGWNY